MEVLALNLVEKTLLMKWEKLAQSPLKIFVKNNAQTPKFIRLEKLAIGVWQTCRSTGQRSYSRPLCHRSTGRSTEARIQRVNSLSDRPPGRPGPFQIAELSGRSTGSVGRPSCQNWLCTSVHVGRPGRSTGLSQNRNRDLKLGLLAHIKIS